MAEETYVDFPFGEADLLSPNSAANLTIEVRKRMTILRPTTLGANMAIDATFSSELKVGSILVVEVGSDATARSVTFGAGFLAPVLAGVISKKKAQALVYNGIVFIAMGAPVQLD